MVKNISHSLNIILNCNNNFPAISSKTKTVTTAVDQTLTCTIGELDVGGTPVNVVWKDPDGLTVSVSDTTNYVISQGRVDGTGIQLAELTIKAAKLADFAAVSSFTYKCSVTSSQYANSPASSDVNVVAKVLELGKIQTKAAIPIHLAQIKGHM